ncbi:hypothetical protein SAMN05518801_106180 [Novosphingobium sp. CF614]|uniref:hypothetical protein n=1 Tax=Novosphingobium sp. CF614 TaxID=1884364 RepID=UPI0008E94F37|nr:hypothetical protein [Novosphingobium sp. CF614]SFG05716.1 hypothetical protein SAMN05518801_106180 [Novosphingobium sp. CF614]
MPAEPDKAWSAFAFISSVRDIPAPLLMVLFTLVATLPVLFVATPPMSDALGHMGRYAIQTGLEQAPWLAPYYSFHWKPIGNLGADILIEMLAPLCGVERGTMVIVVLTQFIAASAILSLSRALHGRITPFAIFALPLIYSVPFNFGFLNFSLSMALALHAFRLWLALDGPEKATLRATVFVPLSLLLWLCHTFGWIFLGLLCTAHGIAQLRETGRSVRQRFTDILSHCAPLLAPLLPMLAWRSATSDAGISGWFSLYDKAFWAIGFLRLEWSTLDRLSAAMLILVVYYGVRSSEVALNRTMAYAALLGLFAYVILPKQVFGSFYADMRLAPYVVAVSLLALRPARHGGRAPALLWAAAIGFLVFRLILTGAVYLERERDLERHMAALTVIPKGARLATLVRQPCIADWDMPWLTHMGGLAIARKHVFSNDQWATPGMNLLSVHYPAAGSYTVDDSELIFPDHCARPDETLDHAIANLPLAAFTHVWVVGFPPGRIPRRPGLVTVWASQDAVVFKVAVQ